MLISRLSAASAVRIGAFGAICALGAAVPGILKAQTTIAVAISTNYNGQSTKAIPSDFIGLSFEMDDTEDSPPIFSGTPGALSTLFQTLGVKSIRLGGDTGETGIYPSQTNADGVNDFCQLIGANLQWLLPVEKEYSPSQYSGFAADMLADKASKNQTFQTAFEIGNEPDLNGLTETVYDDHFLTYINALISAANSSVQVSGPDAGDNLGWAKDIATNSHYVTGGPQYANVAIVTGHKYLFGASKNVTSASQAVAAMLSPNAISTYQGMVTAFPSTAQANGHAARFSETSSFSGGGYAGASDAFAAALWTADYLGYMATSTNGAVSGLNFHNVGGSAAYNVFTPYKPATSYTAQGEAYGILAFNQLGGGFPVPVTISPAKSINLTAYAVAHSSGAERLLIVNKSYGSTASTAKIMLSPGKTSNPFTVASISYMTAPGGTDSPFSTSGMTLGGSGIAANGSFTMSYPTTLNASNGNFIFDVPAAQIAVVYLHY